MRPARIKAKPIVREMKRGIYGVRMKKGVAKVREGAAQMSASLMREWGGEGGGETVIEGCGGCMRYNVLRLS